MAVGVGAGLTHAFDRDLGAFDRLLAEAIHHHSVVVHDRLLRLFLEHEVVAVGDLHRRWFAVHLCRFEAEQRHRILRGLVEGGPAELITATSSTVPLSVIAICSTTEAILPAAFSDSG